MSSSIVPVGSSCSGYPSQSISGARESREDSVDGLSDMGIKSEHTKTRRYLQEEKPT
jgi:hypothetical protein